MFSASMSPAVKPILSKQIETVVTAFAQMAVVCTFGLAVTIGAAGIARMKLPLLCPDCAAPVAMATLPLRA